MTAKIGKEDAERLFEQEIASLIKVKKFIPI